MGQDVVGKEVSGAGRYWGNIPGAERRGAGRHWDNIPGAERSGAGGSGEEVENPNLQFQSTVFFNPNF